MHIFPRYERRRRRRPLPAVLFQCRHRRRRRRKRALEHAIGQKETAKHAIFPNNRLRLLGGKSKRKCVLEEFYCCDFFYFFLEGSLNSLVVNVIGKERASSSKSLVPNPHILITFVGNRLIKLWEETSLSSKLLSKIGGLLFLLLLEKSVCSPFFILLTSTVASPILG